MCIFSIVSGAFAQSLPPPVPSPRGNSEQEQPSETQSIETKQDHNNPSATTPPTLKITEPPEHPNITQGVSNNKTSEAAANWWTAIGTLAIAGITLIQMIITSIFLYRTLRVTQQAAAAATKSAEVAAQALHLTERAYIHVTDWELNLDGTAHDSPRYVAIRITNVGHTPALELKVSMAYSIEPSLPEIPRYEQWSTPETLPPTAHRLFPESPHLLYIPAIEHEDVFLWVWGCVTYKDVFGTEHQNGFCAQCYPQRLPHFSYPTVPEYVYAT
jgi:hypothetical protein